MPSLAIQKPTPTPASLPTAPSPSQSLKLTISKALAAALLLLATASPSLPASGLSNPSSGIPRHQCALPMATEVLRARGLLMPVLR